MPRLRDRQVLNAGLIGAQLLWEQEGFALADGYDEATGKYRGLVLPTDLVTVHITDATLIVRPEPAKAQRAAEASKAPVSGAHEAGDSPARPGQDGAAQAGDTGATAGPPRMRRYFGTKRLQADRHASDFKKLFDEVLGPLAATPGVDLRVTVEIEAAIAGWLRRRQDADGVRERDYAEVRPEQLRGRVVQNVSPALTGQVVQSLRTG